MKKLLIITTLFISMSAFADKYTDQMTKNISLVYNAATIDDLQTAINAFERIGSAEKSKWEPYYYASFGYIMMATREADKGKKDTYLDLAKTSLDKASALKKDESEIFALEGFIHMIRVTVDPATRGPQYSMMAMQSYGKALELDPNNPRALGLLAQLQFGTAKFFSQAPTEACVTARKSLDAFDAQSGDITVAPSWGKGMSAELVKGCQ